MSSHDQATSTSGHDIQTSSATVVPFSLFSEVDSLIALRPCITNTNHGYNAFDQRFSFFGIPITESWCTVGTKHKDLRGWPKCSTGYAKWIKRVSNAKGESWKSGIYDMIQVSTMEISHHVDLLLPLMSFWSTTINAFVFSWGSLLPLSLMWLPSWVSPPTVVMCTLILISLASTSTKLSPLPSPTSWPEIPDHQER